jgi:nitrile hydratase
MTEPGKTHMHDFETHVRAVEADLEYYRRKRFESRMLHLIRRGIIPFATLLRAHGQCLNQPGVIEGGPPAGGLESQIRHLEDRLDQFVRDLGATRVPLDGDAMVIDDNRKERGDYDPFFRLAKHFYSGALLERIEQLDKALDDCELLLNAYTKALIMTGHVTEEQLIDRRRRLAGAGHLNGARIVARAWVDESFKQRLLEEGRPAVRELDIPPGRLGLLGVAENTPEVHNVVVCTLCSCYPTDLLGTAPWWYRTEEYRQRIVEDPRATLARMFDLDVPEGQVVRVHDSTSDVRWMVLPQRPAGTEGMTEDQLAQLVTPESLVGTATALPPPAPVEHRPTDSE